jgi:hypothetical protein
MIEAALEGERLIPGSERRARCTAAPASFQERATALLAPTTDGEHHTMWL